MRLKTKAVLHENIKDADTVFDFMDTRQSISGKFEINPENATLLLCDGMDYQVMSDIVLNNELGSYIDIIADAAAPDLTGRYGNAVSDIKFRGVMGCDNRHIQEETLIKAYLTAWNALVEDRDDFIEQWTEELQSEKLLEGYRAEKFIEYIDRIEPLTEMDTDSMLKTLHHIKVFKMEHCC